MELHAVLEETMNDEHDDIKSVSFANQEEELLAALGSNKLEDEDLRKRYVMRLFDRFRMEYTSISMRLRDSLRNQRQIMEKFQEMKNQLVLSAAKAQTQKKVQEEENKTLSFYRQECENAWKEAKLSQLREKEAMRIIEELKQEINSLQLQINTLINYDANTTKQKKQEAQLQEKDVYTSAVATNTGKSSSDFHVDNGVTSLNLHQCTNLHRATTSPSKNRPSKIVEMMSFEDWKAANRVWSSANNFVPKAETPTIQSLQLQHQSQQLLVKNLSGEVLHPTPMQRAIATAARSTRAKSKKSATPTTPTRNIHELPHV